MRACRRLFALFAAIFASVGLNATSASAEAPPPGFAVAIAADLAVVDGRTRLTLTMSRSVEVSAFHLERPDRVVLDLPALSCHLPPEAGRRRAGLVQAFRCGLFALGRSRLVIDLAGPAVVSRLAVENAGVEGVERLVVELAKTDRESFRRTARTPDAGPETTGSIAAADPADHRPLVAIDAGHGGLDSGAMAVTGDHEKDIVLTFAQILRDRLEATAAVRVLMIRNSDVFVPLDERVRIARAAGVDLFVSVHADSITSPWIRGATLYTGAERATDLESARLAERENAADALGGIAPGEARVGVSDILQDLTVRETRGFSRRVAGLLHEGLGDVTRFTAQPHREAGFRVLRAADMTSILVELGYLSSAKDADLLLSDDWRRRMAAAMASAIERFFGPRFAGRAAVSP